MSFELWQDKIMEVVDAKIHSTKSKFKPSEPVSAGWPQLLEILESPGKISISLNILETPGKK